MKFRIAPWLAFITGFVMGVLAAVGQGFFGLQPPVAAGVCLVSHPRDLINWVVNAIFLTNFTIHEMSLAFPVLTPIGVIIGSFIAAVKNREFRLRPGPVRDNIIAIILGFLVATFALMWGSCPIRTDVLVSYGFLLAVLVLLAMIAGDIVACEYVKWKARRGK